MKEPTKGFLIIDAVALIDFRDSDPTILKLISSNLGQLHVATLVLDEVKSFDESDCAKYGVIVIEPSFEQLESAISKQSQLKTLSLPDLICLILAKENGWTCITNDKRLRRECQNEGIKILWGLEALVILAENKVLSVKEAKEIARNICKINIYLTESILNRFYERIDACLDDS